MSRLKWPTTDDQSNVNFALDKLDIRWMNLKRTQNIDTFEHEIYGVCKNKMIVMLMPFNVVCRHTCNAARREEYYVWHALTRRTGLLRVRWARQEWAGHGFSVRTGWHYRHKQRGWKAQNGYYTSQTQPWSTPDRTSDLVNLDILQLTVVCYRFLVRNFYQSCLWARYISLAGKDHLYQISCLAKTYYYLNNMYGSYL